MVAATYIGTVVGAGFASGQEVLQFFGYFGIIGLMGLFAAGFLFYYFGYNIMVLGGLLRARSHVAVINYAGGRWVGRFIDYVITFFLFGALTAMTAGAGSIFQEQYELSPFLGNVAMTLITTLTVMAGISGVITAISIVVPLLLASVFGIALYVLISQGLNINTLQIPAGSPAVPWWPLAALVYVSYNLVVAVAVLGPLGNEVNNNNALKNGALWGGIGLAAGGTAILLAMLATLPYSARYDIPMIYIAGTISPLVQVIYSGVLLAEVYTTAVGSLFGFVARLAPNGRKKTGSWITIAAGIAALVASQAGFTNLVKYLYPLVGYAGLLMLGGLLYRKMMAGVLVPGVNLRILTGEQDRKKDQE